jgi:hypothetical protein
VLPAAVVVRGLHEADLTLVRSDEGGEEIGLLVIAVDETDQCRIRGRLA